MSIFDIKRGHKRQEMVNVTGYGALLPVTVVRGHEDGPNVLITAGIHNQEYAGIETANRLAAELEAECIKGCVCIIHVCNPVGFFGYAQDVVPEDGENLNRAFPGSKEGSASQKLADFICETFLNDASFLIDLHCGGWREELIPHVYYQGMGDKFLENASKRMAGLVEADYMVRSGCYTGSLLSFASKSGVPGVIIERGGMGEWSEEDVNIYLADIKRILERTGVMQFGVPQRKIPALLTNVDYFAAETDGCWYPSVQAGTIVMKGESLGCIRDFFGNELFRVEARTDCVILYQTRSLAMKSGDLLLACGVIE